MSFLEIINTSQRIGDGKVTKEGRRRRFSVENNI
jgi:hypothetical protein